MNWSSKWSFDLNLSLTDITVVRYVPRQNPFFPLWEIIIKSYFLIYHSIYNFLFFSFFFSRKNSRRIFFSVSLKEFSEKKKMEKNVDLFHTWKYVFLSIKIFFFTQLKKNSLIIWIYPRYLMCISADVLIQNIIIGRAVDETISRVWYFTTLLWEIQTCATNYYLDFVWYVFTADGWMNLRIMFIIKSFVC